MNVVCGVSGDCPARGQGLFWCFICQEQLHPSAARPALRHSLRAFIRPHASGVQTAFFTPFASGEREGATPLPLRAKPVGGGWEGVGLSLSASSKNLTPPQPSPLPSAKGREQQLLPLRAKPVGEVGKRFSSLLSASREKSNPSPALPFTSGEREGATPLPLRAKPVGGGWEGVGLSLSASNEKPPPSPTRPALRHSLRAFIRPHASGVQTALFTPFAFGKREGEKLTASCHPCHPHPASGPASPRSRPAWS